MPNIEGGWMEGSNSRGQVGLFPESYVVPYFGAPPSMPPVSYCNVRLQITVGFVILSH
ncbi:unnamed protein product [Haemonchus placei]|uniref:SH3 domain-containing protein n=1 Tax=Haemonchus placei TaxID=6290 RepID=A0A0N4WMR9_HAEPC|nr:unnamed protein product [Haemonchus placei]